MLESFNDAEKILKPNPEELFGDVYDKLTPQLKQQLEEMKKHVKQYKEHYPLDLYQKMD